MPAAKIIGSVTRVEILVEVYGYQIADRPFHQKLFHLLRFGRVAGIKRDCYALTCPLFGVKYRLTLLLISAERVFGYYIASMIDRPNYLAVVNRVNRGDGDPVGVGFFYYSVGNHKSRRP